MKTISFWGLSVMAVLSLAGCSNDELVEKKVAGNYTLNASVEDFKNDSRAALTDDYKFQWTNDDKIGLLGDKMSNVELSQNASGSSKYGQFSGNVPADGVPLVAYFPYETNVSVTLETAVGTGTPKGKFSITLPDQATDDIKAPMCGDVIGDKVSFQHLCALLKVTIHDIPTEAAKLVLTSSNQALTGKANIKYADGSYVLEMDADANSTTGKVVTYSLASFSGTKTFLFSIPPALEAYDKLTVSLQKEDGSPIEEKELTNTIFTAGSIYVTPPFSAKAAEQVSSLADVTAKFADTPNVTVTETIDTSNGNATITIPQSDQPLNLTFQNAPVASANNPIKIEGTSASIVTLAVPAASTSGTQKAADYTINTKAEITCAAPSTSNAGRAATDDTNCYNYGKVTVTDVKEITIARDVKVEILEINASTTVRIYGYVKEVVPKKSANEISIINSGGTIGNRRDIAKWDKGTIETITGSRSALVSKRGYISEWDGSLLKPELTQDGTTYEVFDASELAWFQNKTSLSTTASNITATIDKNAILYVDIDLKNRPWKGMVLGKDCAFDGGDCTISNLAIKEFILNEQSIYTPNACLGLFGAAMQGSSIKNVTLDEVAMTAAAKWAGALVGLSYGAVSYENCIAKNVTITANDFYSYRVGGLIGFIAAINDKNVAISNCHTENVNINAGFALGGLIGTIQGTQTITISNSSVNNVTMTMSNSFENWLNNSSDWNPANGTPADYIGYMAGFIGDPGMHHLTMTSCSVSSATLLNGHFDLYKNGAGKAFIGGSDFLGRVDNPENVTISLNGTTPKPGVDYNKFEN